MPRYTFIVSVDINIGGGPARGGGNFKIDPRNGQDIVVTIAYSKPLSDRQLHTFGCNAAQLVALKQARSWCQKSNIKNCSAVVTACTVLNTE